MSSSSLSRRASSFVISELKSISESCVNLFNSAIFSRSSTTGFSNSNSPATRDRSRVAGELEFEKPVVELREKIAELKRFTQDSDMDLSSEITKLEARLERLEEDIYTCSVNDGIKLSVL